MQYLTLLLLSFGVPSAVLAQKCASLQFVWARATGEPPRQNEGIDTREGFEAAAAKTSSKGYGSVGYAMLGNVNKNIPGVTSYPIHYVANGTFPTSIPLGVQDMMAYLRSAVKACPQQKYVLGGHSQGGYVTVGTLRQAPKEVTDKIIAVTMFGSPECPKGMANVCRSYCNKGDWVCDPTNAPPKAGKGPGAAAPGGAGPKQSGSGPKGNSASLRNVDTALQQDCGSEPPVRGYDNGNIQMAHTSYVRDGIYIKAATCFISKQWKGSK